ncbi:ComEC/Rec2 family competence protein [Patescibacteria group bacterium]|nr:ComEC/Rec2 family competence protein [Patescibacteria group bacterium]MBU1034323.1 ComEC/Rec2 family competence protein [Patescibacteria group bacterium]MBU1630056.1 ComEC/Rec2 family competence protein [Patescibacteria group bacterium]MBU1907655.1 ComEC/Rec2 family competence protein [Patescibacteria group bacterium]
MNLKFPRSVGAVSGWMIIAFILGVAFHSAFAFQPLPDSFWKSYFFLCAFLIAFFVSRGRGDSQNSGLSNTILPQTMLLVLFAFSLGVWRVDVAPRPHLQRFNNRIFLVSQSSAGTGLAKALVDWRLFVSARIAKALPPDQSALVAGILYGEKQLSKEQRDAFVASGLMHIVAVSGSNVTVVVQFISFLVLSFGLRRRSGFLLTSLAIVSFVGFVGFSASVARAATMGWLILLARLSGRIVTPSRILFAAAAFLLLINPWQLFYDIGFALSFLAMWGLLSWAPLFQSRLSFLTKRLSIRESVSMTLAATLMTAPYLAWAFERMTLAGLITNIIVLPLVPFTMLWGAVSAAWGDLPFGFIVNAPAEGLAVAIQKIASLAEVAPWLNLKIYALDLSTVVATYALIFYLRSQLSAKNELSTIGRNNDRKAGYF